MPDFVKVNPHGPKKGGGQPDMAMAGGTDASKLGAALESVRGWVGQRV